MCCGGGLLFADSMDSGSGESAVCRKSMLMPTACCRIDVISFWGHRFD